MLIFCPVWDKISVEIKYDIYNKSRMGRNKTQIMNIIALNNFRMRK